MNAISPPTFDVQRIREDFPILSQTVRGKPLVFLDSAASAQKPRAVIAAMTEAMETQYANVHRGLHWMSERTTDAYEAARDRRRAPAQRARGRARSCSSRNSTEAINLVAYSYGRGCCKPGQAVLISEMEHHSNIVPWQMLRDERGIELRIAPVTDAGRAGHGGVRARCWPTARVGLVAITHMSNVLGTCTPGARIAAIAHAHGARVLFDGSQAAVHRRVDVQALGADFYAFTGHKLYGPTGIGVLWARRELLERDAALPRRRRDDRHRRAGSAPPGRTCRTSSRPARRAILEAIGLGAAIDYVNAIGHDAIEAHEAALTEHALARLGGHRRPAHPRLGAGPRRRVLLRDGGCARA